MRPFAMLIVLMAIICSSTAKGQEKDYVTLLQQTPPYDTLQQQSYPAFTYQPASDPQLVALRKTYKLDMVAGKGSDVERAIRLLDWFHQQVPHEDVRNIPVLTAQSIIEHQQKTKGGQGCYPLAIGMNEIFLAMGFKSRVVICFSGLYPEPQGGHVINSVYIDSLQKWVYMDPQENAYIKDEEGRMLSIAEVRQRIINKEPLILNTTANYHNVPTNKEEYLYQFMAQHLYRMICPLNSAYNTQTRSDNRLLQYVELLPAGSKDPRVDMFETGVHSDYRVINYHTNNNRLFWQRPA